jgi:hypothetical protein
MSESIEVTAPPLEAPRTLTYKQNRIEIVRNLVDGVFLDTVQRLTRQTLVHCVTTRPVYFRPDHVEKRHPLGRLLFTEAIMCAITQKISEMAGVPVLPTFSYPVIYFPGAELPRHTDRDACEITGTLTIINEPNTTWPIYIEDALGVQHHIDLNAGDLVIYDGVNFAHWRKPQPQDHFNVSVFYGWVVKGGRCAEWHERELTGHPVMPNLFDDVEVSSLFVEK